MPVYTAFYQMEDSYGRVTSKTFESVDLADEATALTSAAGLADDLSALSEIRVLAYTVGRRVVYTDVNDTGSNKDTGVTFTMRKEDNYKAPIKVPGPVPSIFNSDGSVDVTDALVTAFTSNFLVGGDWTFSDGEQATMLVSGVLDD